MGQFPSELFGVPLQTLMAPFASCQRQTEVVQILWTLTSL